LVEIIAKIGRKKRGKFEKILFSENAVKFYTSSLKMSEKCKKCKYLKICRSSCRRYKNFRGPNNLYENKFCDAYMSFFDKNIEKLFELAKITKEIIERT